MSKARMATAAADGLPSALLNGEKLDFVLVFFILNVVLGHESLRMAIADK